MFFSFFLFFSSLFNLLSSSSDFVSVLNTGGTLPPLSTLPDHNSVENVESRWGSKDVSRQFEYTSCLHWLLIE